MTKDTPRMKETEADRQVATAAVAVASEELRAFVERIERQEAEKAEVAESIKEIYAEAKGRGYDVKVLRTIIRRRKQDADEVAEFEAVFELYATALGLI